MHTARDRHTYYVLSQEKSQIIDRELLLECRLLTRQEHIHSWTNSVHEKMSVTTRQRPPIIDKGPALPTTEDNLSNLVQAPSINIILWSQHAICMDQHPLLQLSSAAVRLPYLEMGWVSYALTGRVFRGSSTLLSAYTFAICRSYDLIRKHLWRITFSQHSFASFENCYLVCIYHECYTSKILNREFWRQGICAQFARVWDISQYRMLL